MNLNSNNEKFIQTSKDDNFKAYNATICNDEHFKSSQKNLIMIYIRYLGKISAVILVGHRNLNFTNYQ